MVDDSDISSWNWYNNSRFSGEKYKYSGIFGKISWFFYRLRLVVRSCSRIIRNHILPDIKEVATTCVVYFDFLAGEIGYIVPIVASFLMAIGLLKVISPSLKFIEDSKRGCNLFTSIFIILICIHGIGTALNYNTEFHYTINPVSYTELRDVEVDCFSAIEWANDNSNENSRFFVVGDQNPWWGGDWLPVLAQTPVINAGYGSEWNGNLSEIRIMNDMIIEKLKNGDISSSERIANDYGTYFSHLFIIKSDNTVDLITILKMDDSIETVYENGRTIIFEVVLSR